jgi:hypothetical protein
MTSSQMSILVKFLPVECGDTWIQPRATRKKLRNNTFGNFYPAIGCQIH